MFDTLTLLFDGQNERWGVKNKVTYAAHADVSF
jgi:hypothetical protein